MKNEQTININIAEKAHDIEVLHDELSNFSPETDTKTKYTEVVDKLKNEFKTLTDAVHENEIELDRIRKELVVS